MSTAVHPRRDHDHTALRHVLGKALILGAVTALVVVLMSFITRLLAGPLELLLGGVVLLAGIAVVTVLPGLWTGARTIEGIAGAAAIGLAATVVFLLIDVALLQPLGMYSNRWREVGGGSNWWYHPVWWMAGTYLPWLGALIIANRAARGRGTGMFGVLVPAVLQALLIGAVAVLAGFPGATWSLATFGVAFLPALALAAALSALGPARR